MVSEIKTTEAPRYVANSGASPDDDRHRRLHQYRSFCCLRGNHFSTAGGWGTFLLYHDWPDGVLPDDQSGRTGRVHAGIGSFSTYGQKYVEEGFGFALGWNYWYNWAVTIAVDLVAATAGDDWWFPDTPGWIWARCSSAVIFLLNYISVRGFGEAEYWFSLIKVASRHHLYRRRCGDDRWYFKGAEPAGWSNWTIGDAPFAGGLSAMIGVAMIVGFSFGEPS